MQRNPQTNDQLWLSNLAKLARVVFDLVDHEENTERLGLLCHAVAELKPLLDEAEKDLHPDLGLELLEFVQLKDDSLAPDARAENGLTEGTAATRQVVLDILDGIRSRQTGQSRQ